MMISQRKNSQRKLYIPTEAQGNVEWHIVVLILHGQGINGRCVFVWVVVWVGGSMSQGYDGWVVYIIYG